MDCLRQPELSGPALFQALPRAAEVIPWMPLAAWPTRVERIDGLLPGSAQLWVKREDTLTPYGGNKVRKLEFLFGEARARGCSELVTFGGAGSHHVVATSIYGPPAGFRVTAVLFPQPVDEHVREQLLVDQAAGARLIGARNVLGVLLPRLRTRGEARWLAGGGSSALGSLGWVSGGLELRAQVAAGELPPPDVVYAALGSGGTVAGLCWSLRAASRVELVAVRVVGGPTATGAAVRRLVRGIDRLLAPLGPPPDGEPPRLRVEGRFLGDGYGRPSAASREAVALAARHGLTLDPIYTGKVMAALLADARAGRLANKRVLFLHSFNTTNLQPFVAQAAGPRTLPPRLRQLFEAR